jgi:CBS domain-containing protein
MTATHDREDAVSSRATVVDAMIRSPKVCGLETTVAQVREQFRDDHVHAVLVVDNGRLVAVVERPDIAAAAPELPAHLLGRLSGRVTGPDADLDAVRQAMTARRLAVVDDRGILLGLLCLKRTGLGFCSDADVAARADERRNRTTTTDT